MPLTEDMLGMISRAAALGSEELRDPTEERVKNNILPRITDTSLSF